MFNKKYLRGDADLPFNSDPETADAVCKALLPNLVTVTHEPLWFLRNRGTCTPEDERLNQACVSVENIDVMEKLGIQMPKRVFFFKGFGLERERPYIEKTIQYARELHRRNMLVSIYVGGTMFTDYFFKEVPEARKWARVDMDGLPVTYANYQLQRWFPCLNNPDYRAYMKKVLDIAIKKVDADEIFFDNQILRYEPRTCRCDYCVKHLRDMVKKKYSLADCEQRYGLPEYPDVMPPVFSQANKPWRLDNIVIPQIQDWVDHRVSTVVEFYQDMAQHVKAMKSGCAVGMNIKGIHGHNRAFDHGISHGHFAGILDYTCIDGYRPGRVKKSGAFWSEVRLYKQTHSTNVAVVDGSKDDLPNVESIVLAKHPILPGHGRIGADLQPVTPITRFLAGNRHMFYDHYHCEDIAVLRSEPSTNYNCGKVHEQLMAFEQTLIVEKMPWGIIFDKNIRDLSKHRIIALPEIQAISEQWLDALDAFMKSGGGIIATGGAGDFNDWYRRRTPAHAFDRWGIDKRKGYQVATVGKGRFVYVPEWDVHTRWSIDDWFSIQGEGLMPVKDRALFRQAVSDALGGQPLAHTATGNDFTIIEGISFLIEESGLYLHVINYDASNTEPVLNINVALPAGKSKATVDTIDPENEKGGYPERRIDSRVERASGGQTVAFSIPTPRVYSVVKVLFE